MQAKGSAELTIVHIVNGCHNWTDGKTIAEKAYVTLQRGGRLTILNQDVDIHKLVQFAGPRIATGTAMAMNATAQAPLREVRSLPVQDGHLRDVRHA
jgi:hypothetical protein